jgi:hypothetical protein
LQPRGPSPERGAWFQFWIKDGAAANEVAAGNGLTGVTY